MSFVEEAVSRHYALVSPKPLFPLWRCLRCVGTERRCQACRGASASSLHLHRQGNQGRARAAIRRGRERKLPPRLGEAASSPLSTWRPAGVLFDGIVSAGSFSSSTCPSTRRQLGGTGVGACDATTSLGYRSQGAGSAASLPG
jgi:hypothetical protein